MAKRHFTIDELSEIIIEMKNLLLNGTPRKDAMATIYNIYDMTVSDTDHIYRLATGESEFAGVKLAMKFTLFYKENGRLKYIDVPSKDLTTLLADMPEYMKEKLQSVGINGKMIYDHKK